MAPAYGATGFLVASRQRLTGCRVQIVLWDGQRIPYMVEATLREPGGPVALRLVHTLAPFPAYWREWSAALAAVGRSVRGHLPLTGRVLITEPIEDSTVRLAARTSAIMPVPTA